MKKFDFLFSIICALMVAEVLREFGYFFYGFLFFFLPILALVCLMLSEYIGKKFLFIYQAGKHVISGTFASIIDLKIFEILFWFSGFPITSKTVSFILASFVKYFTNKYWTFKKTETKVSKKELLKFLATNLVGLLINVFSFAFLTKVAGSYINMSGYLWIKTSVVISAILGGLWNFCGDKFIVFKK